MGAGSVFLLGVPLVAAEGSDSPSPPQDVRITPEADGTFTVTWLPPAYDGGAPIVEYQVRRLSENGWNFLGTTPDLSFYDSGATGPVAGLIVGYEVTVENALGQTSSSTSFLALGNSIPGRGPPTCYFVEERVPEGVGINGSCLIIFLADNGPSAVNQTMMMVLPIWRDTLVPILNAPGDKIPPGVPELVFE